MRFLTGVTLQLKIESTGAAGKSATRRKWVRQKEKYLIIPGFLCFVLMQIMNITYLHNISTILFFLVCIYSSFGLESNMGSCDQIQYKLCQINMKDEKAHSKTKTMTQSL